MNSKLIRVPAYSYAFLVLSTAGYSQTATQAAELIEEIVVTAQKRQQDLQSVGIAISVLDAEELAER